jgi:hypothetical protein
MGTRSMIAIQNPYSKDVRAVYCHWDGYLAHNGAILAKHYADSPKVNNLIALGDLSSLGRIIGDKHPFSPHTSEEDKLAYEAAKDAGACTFYTRDRGEDAPFKVFPTLKEAESYFEGSWCEYLYVFKYNAKDDYQSGEWHFKQPGGRWKKLAPAIRKLNAEECAE